jgi:hypothetical protein
MSEYRVAWEIEVDGDTPLAAAQEALNIQRDPESIATSFDVTDEQGRRWRADFADDSIVELPPLTMFMLFRDSDVGEKFLGIFSTREKAEARKKEDQETFNYMDPEYDIDEVSVDA